MPPRGRPNEPTTDRELNENDIINVINGDMERDDPFLRYTNRDGLDFVYDFKAGRASMYVRYTMYVYEVPRTPNNTTVNACKKKQD
eukprot:scaffold133392_cov44-Attheya_sp.AAC.2